MATMDDTIYTTNDIYYVNQTYSSSIVNAVYRIALKYTPSTNLEIFLNASSAASNQIWGGVKRADIHGYGDVTSADTLQWLRIFTAGSTPQSVDAYPNSRLVIDELYASWLVQGIGYYGDTTSQPLFLPANIKTVGLVVGSRTGAVNNSYVYYGFDSGPFQYYGEASSTFFVGKDNKVYVLHACRWAADNRLYVRLNGDHILSTHSVSSYTFPVFDAIVVNGTRFKATDATTTVPPSFIENGYVGFYWESITTNPFPSVGTSTNILIEAVSPGPYGFEVFSSTGDLVLSPTKQKINIIETGTVLVTANSTSSNITAPGMTSTNSDIISLIIKQGAANMTYTRYTGYFRITNGNPSDITVRYIIARLK